MAWTIEYPAVGAKGTQRTTVTNRIGIFTTKDEATEHATQAKIADARVVRA